MTLLVDHEIIDLIDRGSLKVKPFDISMVNPSSLDFRLGNKFGKSVPTGKVTVNNKRLNNKLQELMSISDYNKEASEIWAIDPTNKESFQNITIEASEYVLMPGEFIIATTLESFDFKGLVCFTPQMVFPISYGIAAKVAGKSSLGRLGLMNSSVAGFIDPGFACEGITLELFNYSDTPLILSEGMKIGQLMLFRTETPKKDYTKTGRYHNQASGQGSHGV